MNKKYFGFDRLSRIAFEINCFWLKNFLFYVPNARSLSDIKDANVRVLKLFLPYV